MSLALPSVVLTVCNDNMKDDHAMKGVVKP